MPNVESLGEGNDLDFPESWVGEWKGELSIFRGKEVAQTVGVEMKIKELEDGTGFEWTTRYLDERKTVKPYKLLVLDETAGHYQLDEGPIKLDSYFANGTLRSWFKSGEVLIYSQYELVGEHLVFELISGKAVSESDGADPESGSKVDSLPINGFQRMVLIRVN